MKRKQIIFSFLIAFVGILPAFATPASAGQGIAYYKAGFPLVAKPLLISEVQSSTETLPEACFFLGNIYFQQNLPDSAKYYFDKGNQADPLNSINAIGLSMLKIKSNPTQAEVDFKALLKLKQNKKNVDVLIAISNAYLYNGVIDVAQRYADNAKSLKAKYAPVNVLLGDIELAKKNIGESCKYYDQAIYFDKKSKEGFVKYARAYKTVNPDLAIQKLQELKTQEPDFLLVDREMADIYYATNKFDKAAVLYENYLKSGNSNIQDLTQYALTLFLSGQFEKSLEVTQLGLGKSATNPALNRLAMYNSVDLKKNKEALQAADAFFTKSENPIFNYLDFRYYGQAYRNIDSLYLAIPQFEKALTYDSTKTDLWKDISDMYSKLSKYKNSIDAYNKYVAGLSEDKKNQDINYQLARLYYGMGTTDTTLTVDVKKATLLKADSIFSTVAANEPTNYRGNFWRARTNSTLDPETKVGLAKPFYESTATLIESKADPRFNPILIESYSYLAYYFLVQEDIPNSLKYWNKILVVDPANVNAKKAIEGIAKDKKNKADREKAAREKAAAKAAAAATQQ